MTADLPPQPVDRLLAPFREFIAREASGGILLMGAALIALVWANSPLADSYVSLWRTPLAIGVGDLALSKSVQLWINDGLMAIFFLVVGLEIKREVLVGELASPRSAVLPIAAAVGGAVLPAILFLLMTAGDPEASRGWGVPMATDIPFALGVLALLGSRAPGGLKLFLTALAIVDDMLAGPPRACRTRRQPGPLRGRRRDRDRGVLRRARRVGLRAPRRATGPGPPECPPSGRAPPWRGTTGRERGSRGLRYSARTGAVGLRLIGSTSSDGGGPKIRRFGDFKKR